jgi:hypothetical protein
VVRASESANGRHLGFYDADRKNPEHDEITLWLDQHMAEVVRLMLCPNRQAGMVWNWELDTRQGDVFFEVKVQIPSVSEVIRQVRYYESVASGVFYIVSPDTRAAQVILDQGIGFIPYAPDAQPVVYAPGSQIGSAV